MDLFCFYLPQYYPFEENSQFWGKGFTEWHNVSKARPLFKGHDQPKLPGQLGFYDLRLKQTRDEQRDLLIKYGLKGFIYWHYWFGSDKHVMNEVLDKILFSDKKTVPFFLAWANHNWYNKTFDESKKDKLLLKVNYNGIDDYRSLFFHYLRAFQDENYYRINGRLVYIIYQSEGFSDIKLFMNLWNDLAKENNLEGFYFITKDFAGRNIEKELKNGFDAVYNDDVFNIHHKKNIFQKLFFMFKRKFLKIPTIFKYENAIKFMLHENVNREDVIPLIAPRWDHSPRSGSNGIILVNETPHLWRKILLKTKDIISRKTNKLVIIKSWNEWGEGNFLEPDFKNGTKYLDEVKRVI